MALYRETHPQFGSVWTHHSGFRFEELCDEVWEYFAPEIRLGPGDVVLDVGANIGMFSIAASTRAQGLRIYAFEPMPNFYSALQRNISENHFLQTAQMRSFQAGVVGPEHRAEEVFTYFERLPTDSTRALSEKTLEFTQFFENAGRDVQEKLSKIPGIGRIAKRLPVDRFYKNIPTHFATRWLFDRAIGQKNFNCPVMSLDEALAGEEVDRVAMLKVDVEGSEWDVLCGIGPERMQKIDQVVLEGHNVQNRLLDIQQLLRERGKFTNVRLSEPNGSKKKGLNNFLLVASR